MSVVSVVIPTKDRANYIGRSLDSILDQSVKDIEIIIVDDGSTDNTESIIANYKNKYKFIKYIKNENSLGGAVARNQGARVSKGDFIAFLDSDDEWLPSHLEEGLKLIYNKKVKGIYSSFYIQKGISRIGIEQHSSNYSIAERIFLNKGDARTSTFIFEKEAFNKVRFDDKQQKHQDWDLAIRFEARFSFLLNSKKTVVLNYEAENRMSGKMNYEATDYFICKHKDKVSKKALAHFYISLMWECMKREGKTKNFEKYNNKLTFLLKSSCSSLEKRDKQKVLLMKLPTGVFTVAIKYMNKLKVLKEN